MLIQEDVHTKSKTSYIKQDLEFYVISVITLHESKSFSCLPDFIPSGWCTLCSSVCISLAVCSMSRTTDRISWNKNLLPWIHKKIHILITFITRVPDCHQILSTWSVVYNGIFEQFTGHNPEVPGATELSLDIKIKTTHMGNSICLTCWAITGWMPPAVMGVV